MKVTLEFNLLRPTGPVAFLAVISFFREAANLAALFVANANASKERGHHALLISVAVLFALVVLRHVRRKRFGRRR